MPDENRAPPTLSYQSAIPGAETHRAAGIVMLVWSCVLMFAGLPFVVAAAVIGFRIVVHFRPDVCASLASLLTVGAVVFGLTLPTIALMRLALRFFRHQPIDVRPLITATMAFETLAYLAGGALVLLSLAFNWVVLALSVPAFLAGGGLTYTRQVLGRVQYVG